MVSMARLLSVPQIPCGGICQGFRTGEGVVSPCNYVSSLSYLRQISTYLSGHRAHFFFPSYQMTMYRETIRQSIAEIIEPLLQTQGFELVELQLQQRKGQWFIRVFADAEGGISLEDCQR